MRGTTMFFLAMMFSLTARVWSSETVSSDPLPSEIKEKISAFFQRLETAEVRPAIEGVIQGGTIGQNPTQVENLISQIQNSVNIYGKVTGNIYVDSINIGDSLCKASYISKHVNYPLRWSFIFYKSTSSWVLINIEFDDNVEALF
jgi:hypothetical protein